MKKYIILALVALLAGCGGSSGGGGGNPPPSSILSFNPDSVSIAAGTTTQATLTLSTNVSVKMNVTLHSSNTAAATVSPSSCNLSINQPGATPTCTITISAIASGNAEIIATEPSGKEAIMAVNVPGSPQTPNRILFYTPTSTIPLGTTGTVQLILSNPTSSTNINVSFSSSNSFITAPSTSCNLTNNNTVCNVAINANSIGKSTLIATNTSDSSIVASLPVNIVANDGSRHVTIVNKCNQTVWLGIIPASSNGIQPGGGATSTAYCNNANNPNSTNHCPTGTACITTCTTQACIQKGQASQCFWDKPVIDPNFVNKKYALTTGAKTTVTIPSWYYNSNADIVWDGVFVARQGCDPNNTNPNIPSCAVADCPVDSNMGCRIGTGAKPPATQAELTMLRNGGDFYDVEIINGPNIPVAIGPNNRSYPTTIPDQNSYYCAAAGSSITLNSTLSPSYIPGATWQLTSPSANYNLVDTATSTVCTSNAECSAINSAYVCGYTRANSGFNGPLTSPTPTTCGNQLGYLNGFEFCANNPDSNFPPFNCSSMARDSNNLTSIYTNNQFFQCLPPLKTGYPSGPYADTSTVCGSTDWPGIAKPAATAYSYSNTFWKDTVLPTITWLKEACPTCYTYPFDDPSSTFVCRNANTSVPNDTNYTVTFCPNNQ